MIILIRHIVMWKFCDTAEGRTKAENIARAKELLASLPALIPEIKKFETSESVVYSEFSADLMLYSEFETLNDLDSYTVNPHHKKVSEFIRSVIRSRIVHDSVI